MRRLSAQISGVRDNMGIEEDVIAHMIQLRQEHSYRQQNPTEVSTPEVDACTECGVCLTSFLNFAGLQQHLRNSHFDRATEYECFFCFEGFSDTDLLRAHVERFHGSKHHMCRVCGFSSLSRSSNMAHRKTCSGTSPEFKGPDQWECQICFKIFAKRVKLSKHKDTCHKRLEMTHECYNCLAPFDSGDKLRAHFAETHSDGVFSCRKCLFQANTRHAISRHWNACRGNGGVPKRKYQCLICLQHYGLKSDQKVHSQLGHVDTTTPFECYFCYKGFQEKEVLLAHVRSDHSGKAYACPLGCGLEAHSRDAVVRHLARCTATQPVPEQEPGMWLCPRCEVNILPEDREDHVMGCSGLGLKRKAAKHDLLRLANLGFTR